MTPKWSSYFLIHIISKIRVATVREKSGKNKNFSRSGKISVLVKVSEKSGNFFFSGWHKVL